MCILICLVCAPPDIPFCLYIEKCKGVPNREHAEYNHFFHSASYLPLFPIQVYSTTVEQFVEWNERSTFDIQKAVSNISALLTVRLHMKSFHSY